MPQNTAQVPHLTRLRRGGAGADESSLGPWLTGECYWQSIDEAVIPAAGGARAQKSHPRQLATKVARSEADMIARPSTSDLAGLPAA